MVDNYALKARVYPMIILFIPIIIIGIFYSIQFEAVLLLLSSLGIVGALMYLFSQIGRDRGKLKEQDLWKMWGGAPTTQIIRLDDGRIDQHTKERYRKKLQAVCPVPNIPDITLESNNNAAANEVYTTWTKFLIAKTRDPKSYALLLKDNISYGFRRNLWGLKLYGLLLTVLLLIANYVFWLSRLNTPNFLSYPNSFIYSEIALFAMLIFWIVKVTPNWIKIPAFSYAERLYESLENM
jgi:hypothetical protein